jgi:2-phospho-L-lactate guanylyltransferase
VTFAVVPVKALARAKSRLAEHLPDEVRRRLVLAMLEDVLTALAAVTALAGICVIACDAEVGGMAVRFGAEWLREPQSLGYNEAVAFAAAELCARGAQAMLVVPADIPGVSAHEIDAVLSALPAAPPARRAVLVPSFDGRGTNAALLAPPGAFPLRFGEPSFEGHCVSARAHGVVTAVLHLPGAALDLDTPADLERFAAHSSATKTYAVLTQLTVRAASAAGTVREGAPS